MWSKAGAKAKEKARDKAKMSISNILTAAKEKKVDDRYWSEDKELHQKRCKILAHAKLKILDEIDKKESNFWENLIDEYLRPIDKDKEKDKKIKKEHCVTLLILQSIGMLFHNIETLEQIVSHVSIRNISSRKEKKPQIDPLDLLEKMRENYKKNNDEENQQDQVDGMDNMKKKVQDFSRQLSQMK